jgi:UDP-N-acetylglucosamine transferase subunit ALG13
MIFISVGTTPFPFHRMVDVVEGLIKSRKKDEAIIFQHGNIRCDIKGKNVMLYRYLPFFKMEQYIKQARVLVTHGGPATIYQVLAAGKVPYVLPREKKHGEHVNDHQKHFVDFLSSHETLNVIELNHLEHVLCQPMRRKPVRASNDSIHVVAYLNSLS